MAPKFDHQYLSRLFSQYGGQSMIGDALNNLVPGAKDALAREYNRAVPVIGTINDNLRPYSPEGAILGIVAQNSNQSSVLKRVVKNAGALYNDILNSDNLKNYPS